MPETLVAIPEAVLEVTAPDGSRHKACVDRSPYLIGRGAETGNHLQLSDRRISRQCAAIVYEGGVYRLEDRGQRRGLFVNGQKVEAATLRDGDVITFGVENSFELVFHGQGDQASLPELLSRMESVTTFETGAGGLRKLSVLLEATALLHSQLPLEAVLGSMVDHAVALTDADRGLLLEPQPHGAARPSVARQSGGRSLPIEGLVPSQTAIRMALDQKGSVVTEDVAQAELDLQAAQSIIAQRLRSVVVIPLYATVRRSEGETSYGATRGELLGILYLDSRRPAAFSKLERQILDAIAVEAASVLDNARLVARERERQRMEQELGIAREIQQALLPREFHELPHLQVTGVNQPCLEVGGDYFDVFGLDPDRVAFLIADVSGKGLGAALLTTMLQGAILGMTTGQQPAAVFAQLNRFLCEHTEVGRYATVFFGILDADGRLEYINAGHPSPLLIRTGRVDSPFGAECFPVGLIPEAEFKSAVFELSRGDTLALFSDGITEAVDMERREFGVARLRGLLAERCDESVHELQTAVLDAVKEFARGARQADDLTLLLMRYRGARLPAPPEDTAAGLEPAGGRKA